MIKGMIGLMVAIPLGTHVMGAIGSTAAMAGGVGKATQSFVGLGLMGKAASLSQKIFKW